MHITAENIGDVICLAQCGQMIEIEDVSNGVVTYRQETGERYGTYTHEISGVVVSDLSRIQEFKKHFLLGDALISAEVKALSVILCDSADDRSRQDASRVLDSARTQREHLVQKITSYNQGVCFTQNNSLDDMIHCAALQKDILVQGQEKDFQPYLAR